MKKHVAALVITLLIVVTACLYSCRVTTERSATIDYAKGVVEVVERGFVTSPLTAEGPFPKWSEHLEITVRPSIILSKVDSQVLLAHSGFAAQYGKVESGKVTIDPSRQVVIVDVEYTEKYGFSRISGEYAYSVLGVGASHRK